MSIAAAALSTDLKYIRQTSTSDVLKQQQHDHEMDTPPPEPDDNESSNGSTNSDYTGSPIKCSAVHTLERNMPDFDYSNLVEELRTKILNECDENPGTYAHKDLIKCKTDDWYLARFLLRHGLDVQIALDMLKKALRYNHENLASTMRPEDFPAEFYNIGGLFAYEPDRKGNQMLYIRVKLHRKVPEIQAILQAFLYMNIQRVDELANGRGISIVIDCTGGGLANADMDILLFLVSSLVNYFPKGLSYILVHQLPWILKPFWMIARAWVSDEHKDLIKFSNSKTIYEYIDRENLPDFMGGTCKRDYRAAPENCTNINQASKLWGIEPDIVKRVIERFHDVLPADVYEKAIAQCNETIKDICRTD